MPKPNVTSSPEIGALDCAASNRSRPAVADLARRARDQLPVTSLPTMEGVVAIR
jgi:hypothetical protein